MPGSPTGLHKTLLPGLFDSAIFVCFHITIRELTLVNILDENKAGKELFGNHGMDTCLESGMSLVSIDTLNSYFCFLVATLILTKQT